MIASAAPTAMIVNGLLRRAVEVFKPRNQIADF